MADLFCAEEIDYRRREKDRSTREESGKLRTRLLGSCPGISHSQPDYRLIFGFLYSIIPSMPTLELPRPQIDQEAYVYTAFQRRLSIYAAEAGLVPADQLVTHEDRENQYDQLEQLTGDTPLLGLRAPNGSNVLVKAEFASRLTGTHYDRIYVKMLRELEEREVIKPGDTLFEVTSGSAGIAFSAACKFLGYNAVVFVPDQTAIGRNQEIRNLGAELVVAESENIPETSKTEQYKFLRMAKAHELKAGRYAPEDGMFALWTAPGVDGKPGMYMINHSANEYTHMLARSIGREVADVLPDGAQIDYFVSVLGNGTNTRGTSDGLRASGQNRFKTIGIEGTSNPVQFVEKYPGRFEAAYGHSPTFETQKLAGSSQKGTKLSFMPLSDVDDIQLVDERQWRQKMEAVNGGKKSDVETIGRTSAASLVVAERLDREHPGSTILITFYDGGGRYDELVLGSENISSITYRNAPTVENVQMQPFDWKQEKAESFDDLPATLFTAYKPHLVEVFNRHDPYWRNLDLAQR